MDPGTIAVIGPVPPPLNGMTVMTTHVLEALKRSGIRVVHIDTSDHRRVGNVGRLDFGNVVLAAKHAIGMAGAVTRDRPSIVYLPIAQGTLGFLRDALFFSLAERRGIPVVLHLHGAAFGAFYRESNPLMRWIIRRCLRPALRAIVLGSSLRDVFGDLVAPEHVVDVANGLPQPVPFDSPPRRGESVHVLYLSNLNPAKGYLDVIAAANLVARRHGNARFTIAGEWLSVREERAAREECRRMGIEDRVVFTRAVSGLRKAELFRAADLFVFPPRQLEGQPVVILEAMSYGLPVVTTAQGGIVDLVIDGKTGIYVPPGAPGPLADALSRLIVSATLRTGMGEAGRRRFDESFSEHVFRARLTDVLRDALAAASQAPSLTMGRP